MKKVAIGCDPNAVDLKEILKKHLLRSAQMRIPPIVPEKATTPIS